MGVGLTMTPALQQAIRLLQLSSLDLQAEIQQALDSNVMLELEETEPEPATEPASDTPTVDAAEDSTEDVFSAADSETDLRATEIPEEMPVDAEWSDTYDTADKTSAATSNNSSDEELHDLRQANLHSGTSLQDHLAWQARLAPLGEWQREVASHLIDSINEDGYLENWDDACAHFEGAMGLVREQMERVLRVVQDFDPPGVGARNLAECLELQLRQLPASTQRTLALRVIRDHLPLLAQRDAGVIRQALASTLEDAEAALALIQSLQPHPGRPYQAHEGGYLAPDIVVRKHQGRWKVALNPEVTPKVRINPHYLGMVKRADSSRDQLTMKQHLVEARYFISAVESRNDTLLRVGQTIVEEQRAFLEYGDEAMRPLVLRDISEKLGVHESTVSRATANKYMLTPRGLYELKYFFSSHVQTLSGGICSATAIQAMIKRLVGAEAPAQPLSDSALADHLLKDGIRVARRTVAKYREAMGIAPSHERRPT